MCLSERDTATEPSFKFLVSPLCYALITFAEVPNLTVSCTVFNLSLNFQFRTEPMNAVVLVCTHLRCYC